MDNDALDKINPEWKDWVLKCVEDNVNPTYIWDAMVKGNFGKSQAISCVESAYRILNKPLIYKDLPFVSENNEIRVDKKNVKVTLRCEDPQLFVFEDVLSKEECSQILSFCKSKLITRSQVVSNTDGESETSNVRTSSGGFFGRGENSLISALENRLSKLLNWPLYRSETIQFLRYLPGEQYEPHQDWFKNDEAHSRQLSTGGQRVATTLVYIQRAKSGGSTYFPKLNLHINPVVGSAVTFLNMDRFGNVEENVLHGGAPVVEGEKVVLTFWQREFEFHS